FGSAEHGNGVLRLMKALRHEAPGPTETLTRLGPDPATAAATVFRVQHLPHLGRMALARLWRPATDTLTVDGQRIAGLYRMAGAEAQKIQAAEPGAVVGLGRLDAPQAGDLILADGGRARMPDWPAAPPPVDAIALAPADRKDEVKLTAALARLV